MKDLLGKDIRLGDIVIQAAAYGHDKFLKIAVVLEINPAENSYNDTVKVISESRPGDVRAPHKRLLVIDSDQVSAEIVERLYDKWNDWCDKKGKT